jgi:deoxyribodipyrimidine photo-lyase
MKQLHWFRDDLRLQDNPALDGANACIYILEEEGRAHGGANLWWLRKSLSALRQSLHERGVQLIFARGKAFDILERYIADEGFTHITWNRRYTKAGIETDKHLKSTLKAECKSHAALLLKEPFEVKPYKVFTPYWKKHQQAPDRLITDMPALKGIKAIESLTLDELIPAPFWATHMTGEPGEAGALKQLSHFIDHDLQGYAEGRDRPDQTHVSRLAAHLRFGEISPTQIFHALSFIEETRDVTKFKAEIGWREFAYHLLYHYPDLSWVNFNERFNAFSFVKDDAGLLAWQKGMTGYPIVDAGMRELWQTGYMHNRVRMIVASFLIKHLMIDWREGEKWFWDCLSDADPANNAASWQWVAGSGADASPYFRIFNPIIQGEKFDPNGDYVRRFVPELANVPVKYIHRPWESPYAIKNYPAPLIKHEAARERALAAYKEI